MHLSVLLLISTLSAVQVVDGDTIWLGEEKIRIANIDAPEIRSAKCDAERRLGLMAKRRLEELLASGNIELHRGDPGSGRKTDQYGRTLGTITVDGRDVGEILIGEHIARKWKGKRRPWCG